jgi:AcrR family transcriptional regulator
MSDTARSEAARADGAAASALRSGLSSLPPLSRASSAFAGGATITAVTAAVDLFTRHGFDQTSVEQIADAAQESRATFFRRYRSKEDVVFADHELLLEDVTALLAATRRTVVDPYLEACRAARLVFDHHLALRDLSLARHALLQRVPPLRDRQLVTIHRYQRAIALYLRATVPPGRFGTVTSTAFAAAVVAVHNEILGAWFDNPETDQRPRFEETLAELRAHARTDLHGHPLTPGDDGAARAGVRVVVVEATPGTTPDAVADAVRAALRSDNQA